MKVAKPVKVQLLQTLSILVQNINRETSICKNGQPHTHTRTHIDGVCGRYTSIAHICVCVCEDYLLSNNHVNSLISTPFEWEDEEILGGPAIQQKMDTCVRLHMCVCRRVGVMQPTTSPS